jgi:hypothetical protein
LLLFGKTHLKQKTSEKSQSRVAENCSSCLAEASNSVREFKSDLRLACKSSVNLGTNKKKQQPDNVKAIGWW